ncbi:MAG TPA: MG2 domain-containing protein, partial [Polyangiaceae bacterium]
MKLQTKLHWTVSTLGFVLIACSRASSPLPAKVGKPIEIGRRAVNPPRGFAVVFSGPTGDAAPESELQILFSRPLRALTTIEDAAPPSIQMRPAVPGSWRWLGTQALVFSPAQQRLPFGTAIDVEVPATTRALDGTTLGQPHRFTLRTPPPKVERVHTDEDATHLRAHSRFAFAFDQPVAIDPLRRHLRLEVTRGGKTENWPIAVDSESGKPDQVFRVTPQKPLPMAAALHLVISAGLVGVEGPLPTLADQAHEFSTIQPLRVVSINCEHSFERANCDSRSGVDIEFNNPVSLRNLRHSLTIDGKPAKLATWYSETETTAYVHLSGPFRAGSEVTLRVNPGIKDEYGQTLREARSEHMKFDDFLPKMEIGLQGEVFETALPATVPIGAVNVRDYDRVGALLDLPGLLSALSAENSDVLWAKATDMPGVRVESIQKRSPGNQLGIDWFGPGGQKATWLGPALLGVRYEGLDGDGNPKSITDARIVQRTNLGISGQVGRFGSVIWVTALDTAQSVAGAEVSLMQADGRVFGRATTDAEGLARFGGEPLPAVLFEQPDLHPAAFIVKKDGDSTFRRLSDVMPEWRVPVSVDRVGQLGSRLMLFTERGLYRPGERVDVKAVIRDEQARGLTLPSRRELTLELTAPDNHVVATKAVKTSEFGTAAAHFAVPLSAATGQWSVRARYGKEAIGATELTVGEYRPVELEVSVDPSKREILRGAALSVSIGARTLFGMAASKAKVRVEAYRERTQFTPPGADAYVTDAYNFDDPRANDTLSRAQLTLEHRELDQAGHLDVTIPSELPAARGPEWIQFEAEVTDATENPVAASARTLVHPASDYVGLRRLANTWVAAPSRLPIDVASFATDGTRRVGRSVDVELVRRTWSVVRREVNGTVQTQNQATDTIVDRCQVKSAITDVHCNLELARAGSYFVVARSKDEAQRVATSAQALFAIGAGQPDVSDADERRIELVPDKSEYRVGDVAKILVKSAITNVDALVTVGRSELHSVERRHLTGTTPILEIPIREDMRPNMFVAVHLVTGRKRAAPTQMEQ